MTIYQCICGSSVKNMSSHKKSKKHQKYVEEHSDTDTKSDKSDKKSDKSVENTCPCGSVVKNMKRHQRTKKHQKYVETKKPEKEQKMPEKEQKMPDWYWNEDDDLKNWMGGYNIYEVLQNFADEEYENLGEDGMDEINVDKNKFVSYFCRVMMEEASIICSRVFVLSSGSEGCEWRPPLTSFCK